MRVNRAIVKSISQYNASNSQFSPYPIGADGQYIDMNSMLDLEEQLRLGGGNKLTKVSYRKTEDNKDIDQIIEYFSNNLQNNTFNSNTVNYTVFTQIYSSTSLEDMDFQESYSIDESVYTDLQEESFVIDDIINDDSVDSYIVINLYNRYYDPENSQNIYPVHQKIIVISKTDNNNITDSVG